MKKIAAGEFKAKCLDLLDEVQRSSTEALITKRGKPVAKLVPAGGHASSFIGSMKGTMEIVGDIASPIAVRWEAYQGRCCCSTPTANICEAICKPNPAYRTIVARRMIGNSPDK